MSNIIPTYQDHSVFDHVVLFQAQKRNEFLLKNGVDIHQEILACPVVFEGDVDGYYLYYHSRGGFWRVEIGKDFEFHGKDTYYGWTPPHIAYLQIWQAVKEWRKGRSE